MVKWIFNRNDLPIWTSTPGLVQYDTSKHVVRRRDVDGIEGAFILDNVLSVPECDQLRNISESMGYTLDAPVSLGRNVRQNENCVWLVDDTVWRPVWDRVFSLMPPKVAGGTPVGLNQRWRLYKYNPDDVFRLHTDGAWPGSVAGDDRVIRDGFGDCYSQLTFLLYLDNHELDYEGGATSFLVENTATGRPVRHPSHPGAVMRGVRVPQGSVL